jgi:signal peptidase I
MPPRPFAPAPGGGASGSGTGGFDAPSAFASANRGWEQRPGLEGDDLDEDELGDDLYDPTEDEEWDEYDPTTRLENWGPSLPLPAAPAPSTWSTLWPWGLRGIVETAEVLALALLMFMFVRTLGQNFVVDGGSMEPTFQNGEMLIVNKISYRHFYISWLPWSDNTDWRPFGEPDVGDVVVFRFPQNPSRDFIKRIIATAGQRVEIRGGKLYVDGLLRDEPFLSQPTLYEYGPAVVPPGQYFVLGDNRNNSYDSHSWGMLDQSFLIGRAEVRYWPLNRAGRIDNAVETVVSPQAGAPPSASTR